MEDIDNHKVKKEKESDEKEISMDSNIDSNNDSGKDLNKDSIKNKLIPYYSDTIHIANPESVNCILCLWTKKERIMDKLSEENYAFIGQLYSKDYGLQILFRNLLACPQIRNLIIVGVDLNGSGNGLVNFFEKGIDEENKIIDTDVILDDKLTKKDLDILRARVKLHDCREIKDFSKLNRILSKIKPMGAQSLDDEKRIVVALPQINPPIRFPTDFSGFKARGDDFYSAYRSLLSKLSRFGVFYPERKVLALPNIIFFISKFSAEDKKFLLSRKKRKAKIQISEFSHDLGKVKTLMFKELDVWDTLKDVCSQLSDSESLCIIIGEAFIRESELGDVVELLGVSPRYKWESDPHGNLIIRVEDELIKVTHLSTTGAILEELGAKTAKEMFKKIASSNKISMIYHALDIGAELQKAEIALKKGIKYIQDRDFEF